MTMSEIKGIYGRKEPWDFHIRQTLATLSALVDTKSDIGHTHVISEITGLQAALDALGGGGTIEIADVVGLQARIDALQNDLNGLFDAVFASDTINAWASIEFSDISGDYTTIYARGRYTRGDCPLIMLKQIAPGSAPWDGVATTTSNSGAKKWQIMVTDHRCFFSQFGGIPAFAFDGSDYDNADTFNKMWQFLVSTYGETPPEIRFTDYYQFNSTLEFKPSAGFGGTPRLSGVSPGVDGHSRSGLLWGGTGDLVGMILDDDDTLASVYEATPTAKGASGFVLDGLTIWAVDAPAGTESYGVIARTRGVIRNCRFIDWGRANLFIWGEASTSGGGDASGGLVENCRFETSADYNVRFLGPDTEGWNFIACSYVGPRTDAVFAQVAKLRSWIEWVVPLDSAIPAQTIASGAVAGPYEATVSGLDATVAVGQLFPQFPTKGLNVRVWNDHVASAGKVKCLLINDTGASITIVSGNIQISLLGY